MQRRPIKQINIFLIFGGVSLEVTVAHVTHVQPNFCVSFEDMNFLQVIVAAVRTARPRIIPQRPTASANQPTCPPVIKLFQLRHDRSSPAYRTIIFLPVVALKNFKFGGNEFINRRPKNFPRQSLVEFVSRAKFFTDKFS